MSALECAASYKAERDALLEALEWAIRELDGTNRYDEDVADEQEQNGYDRARAVLAAAGMV